MKNWKIFNAETAFDFGTHAGKTLENIAQTNANYILWCFREIDKFLILEDDLIEFGTKYARSLISNNTIANDKLELWTNYYKITDQDLEKLKSKWDSYENYLEMMSNAEYDNYDDNSYFNNEYYNDNLDLDQQDPEFWDSL